LLNEKGRLPTGECLPRGISFNNQKINNQQ
jgi:hypothetical protein